MAQYPTFWLTHLLPHLLPVRGVFQAELNFLQGFYDFNRVLESLAIGQYVGLRASEAGTKGMTGKIVEDDKSEQPYRVKLPTGKLSWFKARWIEERLLSGEMCRCAACHVHMAYAARHFRAVSCGKLPYALNRSCVSYPSFVL